jgi:lysozyme family protein
MNFDAAFDRLLGHEGGYSNHAADTGGRTQFGITEAVARAAGFEGDMRDLPVSTAKAIYRKSYWLEAQCDKLPEALRFDVFDGAVNSGPVQSIKWLQLALGVLDDGVLGPMTLGAAIVGNPKAMLARYNGYRLDFLTDRGNWPNFSRGWARRIASNLQAA